MWACCPLPAPRCCHAHDCCYQKLFDLGCHPYVDHYEYTIENNTSIICSESLPPPTQEKGLDCQCPQAARGARARGCQVKYRMPTYV